MVFTLLCLNGVHFVMFEWCILGSPKYICFGDFCKFIYEKKVESKVKMENKATPAAGGAVLYK